MTSEPVARPPSAPGGTRPTRPPGFRLGNAFGFGVYLRASWLLLAVLVIYLYGPVAQRMVPGLTPVGGYLLALAFVGCLLLSVLLHELGHAITARRFGVGVRSITLELLGGYTEMESDTPSPKADFLVSVIGPVVSAVLGVAALALQWLLPAGTVGDQLAFQLAWSNLLVAVFNALPGLPLDGGRALRAIVWGVSGNRHIGTQVAGWVGRVVAVLTLVVGLLLVFSGLFSTISAVFAAAVAWTLWQGASASILQGRLAARLPPLDLRRLSRPVFTVPTGTPLAEASRRAAQAGRPDSVVAVADSTGRVVALVNDQAASAVPVERRPWVPVESVARTLDPGRTLAVTMAGEDVIRAVQAHPAPSYLVVSGDDVVGVLRTADLARLLQS